MQTNEDLIKRIAENVALRLIRIYANGGGGSFTMPLAADGVRGGVQIGFTTDATARKYAVQLDNEKAYVNVPWTDHHAWSDITDKPATATRWPSWNEVTSKPHVPSVSGSVSGSTLTITIDGSSYSLTDTNTWRPVQNTLDSTATGDSLSAYQGYLLARGSARDNTKLPLAGGTMTGNIYIGNTTIYANGSNGGVNSLAVADDCILGDCNIAGHLGLKSLNSYYAGISFYDLNGSQVGQLSSYNGNIGIGTTSPSYKLHVAGKIYCTGGFAFLSDIRKKNVVGFCNGFSVRDIANAPLIQYTLKGDLDDGRRHIGSVAQYWQKVLPDTVNEADDTLSMDQEAILMASVITLARKVMSLENQIIQSKEKANG